MRARDATPLSPHVAQLYTPSCVCCDVIPFIYADAGNAPGVYGDGDEVFSDDSDDFTVIRRDINSGRPVVSGPVLYSVAETVAQPRCVIVR